MTRDQFNKVTWTGGAMAKYKGKAYEVICPDFIDYTITIDTDSGGMTIPCEEFECVYYEQN